MKSKLFLAAVIAVALALVLGTASYALVSHQELNQTKKAQKRAEEELAKAKEELKSAKAALSELKEEYAEGPGEEETPTQKEAVYTPPKGSAERKAILDAIRQYVNEEWQFIVHHLKVKNGYGYAVVEPYEPPSRHETGSFLLRKQAGKWNVISSILSYADIEESGLTEEQWFQQKFPEAPSEIFK